ncbi:MAG TPA: hypothetical protein VF019_06355 [Nitrospira sp.]
MNGFRRVILIERILSDMKPRHWPFKGSWQRSGKRGVRKSLHQRRLRKAHLKLLACC